MMRSHTVLDLKVQFFSCTPDLGEGMWSRGRWGASVLFGWGLLKEETPGIRISWWTGFRLAFSLCFNRQKMDPETSY